MSTARVYNVLSIFSEFMSTKKAEIQWMMKKSPRDRYNYLSELITYSIDEDVVIQLRYFLEQGLNPNWIPEDIESQYIRQSYLLYGAITQTRANPIKAKLVLSLLNHGAKLSLIADETGHANMMQLLWRYTHTPVYAKLYMTYGLYLPALDDYEGRSVDEIHKIAQEEPDFVNVYSYLTSAENALKEDPANYKAAIENFELAKQCFERIATSEAAHADDSEIYGYDELIVDHYRQRALDCQEAIARCEASQRDSDEDMMPIAADEAESLLRPGDY